MELPEELQEFLDYLNRKYYSDNSSILYYVSYFLYLVAFILLSYFYFFSELGMEPRFQTYIQVLIAATIFMTVYSIYLQQQTYSDNIKKDQVNFFDNYFKSFLDETLKFFVDHPEMNYYYQELFYNENLLYNRILQSKIWRAIHLFERNS